ncbi:hypothetical protein LP414_19865 [Polaromonas sp. P1(28)-13]|nr:hypothetical protein LP414_19865 [Polaromonas sp. P1(28)-13]
MKYFFARKIKYAMPSMATVVSRFSLGIVLTVLPILFAHFYGNDLAKTVALAINLSSYSSWLALGGYATVMRDFRIAKNEFEKYSLNLIYKRLAVFQSIGAILLTSVISIAYVELVRPVYLIDSINLLLIGLMFGVVVQCSSFWLNVALGISYSSDNFVGVSMGVSILRILVLVVVFASSYIPINSEVILIVAMVFCGLGSLFLCRHYSIAPQAPGRDGNVKGKTFASLLAESVIYFKWSLLATAVFVFPITAISSANPDILLPATIAFFLVGASQNMVAALITP